jgi:hypothetical protein
MSSRKQLQQGKKEAQTQEQQPKEEREPQELPLNCPPLSGKGQGQARHKKPVVKQPTSTQAQGLAAARVFQDALFCLQNQRPGSSRPAQAPPALFTIFLPLSAANEPRTHSALSTKASRLRIIPARWLPGLAFFVNFRAPCPTLPAA